MLDEHKKNKECVLHSLHFTSCYQNNCGLGVKLCEISSLKTMVQTPWYAAVLYMKSYVLNKNKTNKE